MAFNKPLPVWNEPGVEVPSSIKNSGWGAGIKPPAPYFNNLHHKTYEALKELQEKAAETLEVQEISKNLTEADERLTTQLAQTKKEVNTLASEKVAKVEGKQLSTNDYTSNEKTLVAQIPQLARQDFVDAQFATIVSGSPKATYTDYEALVAAYPNGTDGTMLILSNGHWYYWNKFTARWEDGGLYQSDGIADNTISVDKLALDLKKDSMWLDKNLVDHTQVVKGKYYSITGVEITSAEHATTALIPVKILTTYSRTNQLNDATLTHNRIGNQVTYWDANGNFVVGADIGNSQYFTVPNNANIAFLRSAITDLLQTKYHYDNNGILVEGIVDLSNAASKILKVSDENIDDESITLSKIKSVGKIASPNLLDKVKMVIGGYFDTSGAWVASVNHNSSDLIPAKANDVFCRTLGDNLLGNQVTYWDANGNFVVGADIGNTSNAFTVPNNSNIAFLRIVIPAGNVNNPLMLVRGATLPFEYTAYGDSIIEITNDNLQNRAISTDKLDINLFTKTITNLYDKNAVVTGGYYGANGVFVATENHASTPFVSVVAGETLSRTIGDLRIGNVVTYWDASGNFLSGIDLGNNSTFTVPNDSRVTKMRLNVPAGTIDKQLMLVRGAQLPDKYFAETDKMLAVTNEMLPDGVISANKLNPTFYKENFLDFIKPWHQVVNPIIIKDIVTDRTGATGVADPFVVMDKGLYHMFFEVLGGTNPNSREKADEIGHAYSYDLKNWTYTQIVISKEIHGHRSAYPNVFKIDGTWYMLPDVGGAIKLYRATNFPLEWELVVDLVNGVFYDTNVFKFDDVWYLTTRTSARSGIDLYVNTSGDFKNTNWTLHPMSPIITDVGNRTYYRAGGKELMQDGYLYLPVQCSVDGKYGAELSLYKLSNLSPATVVTTNMGLIFKDKNDDSWNERIAHHMCEFEYFNKKLYVTDGHLNGEYAIGLYVES